MCIYIYFTFTDRAEQRHYHLMLLGEIQSLLSLKKALENSTGVIQIKISAIVNIPIKCDTSKSIKQGSKFSSTYKLYPES